MGKGSARTTSLLKFPRRWFAHPVGFHATHFPCCFSRKNYYLDDKDGGTPSTTEDDADQRDQPESQSGSMRAVGGGAVSRPYDEKPFVGGVTREETRPFLNGTGPVLPSLPREERLGTNDEDDLIGGSGPPNAELSASAKGQ